MLSLPPELVDAVEQLRAKLVEINGSEQTCMTSAVASGSQGNSRLPEVQAIMAKCRQSSAAAAATAIDTFRRECSELGTQATSSVQAAFLAATATSVSGFWTTSESVAAALVAEAASQLPAQEPHETTQAINNIYRDRKSSINHYFEQLTEQSTAGHLTNPADLTAPQGQGLADDPALSFSSELLRLTTQHPAVGVCVVVVDGELDGLTAPILEACVRDQLATAPTHLILDLQPVSFLDSKGLTCLVEANELAQHSTGVRLHLAGLATRAVAHPLHVTELLELFDTYPTQAHALAALTNRDDL